MGVPVFPRYPSGTLGFSFLLSGKPSFLDSPLLSANGNRDPRGFHPLGARTRLGETGLAAVPVVWTPVLAACASGWLPLPPFPCLSAPSTAAPNGARLFLLGGVGEKFWPTPPTPPGVTPGESRVSPMPAPPSVVALGGDFLCHRCLTAKYNVCRGASRGRFSLVLHAPRSPFLSQLSGVTRRSSRPRARP